MLMTLIFLSLKVYNINVENFKDKLKTTIRLMTCCYKHVIPTFSQYVSVHFGPDTTCLLPSLRAREKYLVLSSINISQIGIYYIIIINKYYYAFFYDKRCSYLGIKGLVDEVAIKKY